MKAEICSSCVLLIKYILRNKAVLDYKHSNCRARFSRGLRHAPSSIAQTLGTLSTAPLGAQIMPTAHVHMTIPSCQVWDSASSSACVRHCVGDLLLQYTDYRHVTSPNIWTNSTLMSRSRRESWWVVRIQSASGRQTLARSREGTRNARYSAF
jgi:hypothetical protein